MQIIRIILGAVIVLFMWGVERTTAQVSPHDFTTSIALKIPGNDALNYPLEESMENQLMHLKTHQDIPVVITRTIKENSADYSITVVITAEEDIYFNFKQLLNTRHAPRPVPPFPQPFGPVASSFPLLSPGPLS